MESLGRSRSHKPLGPATPWVLAECSPSLGTTFTMIPPWLLTVELVNLVVFKKDFLMNQTNMFKKKKGSSYLQMVQTSEHGFSEI